MTRRELILSFVLIGVSLVVGFGIGRGTVQTANDALAAGFVIIDPDGYEVEQFSDGLRIGYWTVEPK